MPTPPLPSSSGAAARDTRRLQQAPLRFVVVGVLCAAFDLGVMQALLLWGQSAWLAASIGFAAGLAANFWGQIRWTFSAPLRWRSGWRFALVVALNYGITLLCVTLGDLIAGAALLGKLVSLPLVALVGYTLSRRWVFA